MNSVDSHLPAWWSRTPTLLLWATLFYVVWNWAKFSPVWLYGDLQGPDSFLRLYQVEAWLAGQGWFDLTAYKMAPPDGADIHWSRLVDLPIALLTIFFDLFLSGQKSGWLAAIVWPYILFLAIYWVVLKICDQLIEGCNPLIVLFFYVLSVSILAETAPGRIDHHNVQILLFAIALLGLVMTPGWLADGLVGISIPLSLSIGMDSAALFLPLLALMGVQWAFGISGSGGRLVRTGIVLILTTLAIFLTTIPPDRWTDTRCDAFSLFYVYALVVLSAGFIGLGALGTFFAGYSTRMLAGILIAAAAVASLLLLFPHCGSGPYGNLDPELHARWLSRVEEAKGIFGATITSPQRWLGDFLYIWLVAGIGVWITLRNYKHKPEFVVLLCAIMFCAVGLFFQIRILRTGVIAAIPICAAFAMVVHSWLQGKSFELAAARLAALGLVCFLLTSFFWYSAGNILLAKEPKQLAQGSTTSSSTTRRNADPVVRPSCSGTDSLAIVSKLSDAVIMSDLNAATPIMLHSGNTAIAGPYHRNGEAILSVLDFFETDAETARKIAETLQVTHVVFCNRQRYSNTELAGEEMQKRLLRNDLPEWLGWISGSQDGLLVLKVK